MITEEYIKELTNTTFFQRGKVKRLQLLLDKQTEEEFKTSKIVILSEITKLRQICCCPALIYEDYPYFSAKENLCVDLIHKAAEPGNRPCTPDRPGECSNCLQINCQGNNRRKYCKIAGKEDGSC